MTSGLGEGRFLEDVRAELEGSRIQMLQTGRLFQAEFPARVKQKGM